MTAPPSPMQDRAWWPWVIFGVATLALLWRPLLGFGALLPIDIVEQLAPWRSAPESGNDAVHNGFLVDTVTVHVHFASMAADLRAGDFSVWDESVGTGFPTLKAGLPIFNWVYLVVPAWFAPGLAAALRTLTAAGLTFGLVRRLGVGRAAATVGGVAYGLCGYLVGWSAWPQSNVAALLPGLFWAVESLVQQARLRTAAGLGLVVAAAFWANFPTTTVYALVFAALYAAARLWATTEPADRLRAFASRGVMAAAGLAAGLALSAWHLLHFIEYLRWSDTTARESLPADSSIGGEYLPSFVLPQPYGASHGGRTYWGQSLNWVEIQSYAGMTVVLLALLGFAACSRRLGGCGAIAERANAVVTWWSLVVAVVVVSYVGGPITSTLNSLPFLGLSTVGRIRVIANLGLAVLAALGVQTMLDGRRGVAGVDLPGGVKRAGIFVGSVAVLCSPLVLSWARVTRAADAVDTLAVSAVVPVALTVALALVLWRWKGAAVGMVAAITMLVGVDLLVAGSSVNTMVDRDAVDLVTEAHEDAIAALAPGERMGGDGRVFLANTGQVTGLVDARGQLFTPAGYRALYTAIDDDHASAFGGTSGNPWFTDVDLTGTVLDRLGVRIWAADPRTPVVGIRGPEIETDGEVVVGSSDGFGVAGVFVPEGGLRALGVVVQAGALGELRAEISAGDAEANAVALLDGSARPLDLVVDADALPVGAELSVTFRFDGEGEVTLAGAGGLVAMQTVAASDDLSILRSGDVVIYDRGRPVSAWVANTVSDAPVTVETHLGPTWVAHLDAATVQRLGLPIEGVAAPVSAASVVEAEGGRIVIDVSSDGDGIVVVPMPEYPGWSATVDGAPAMVLRVDDAFPGVVVPSGDSTVVLEYTPSYQTPALLLTALGALAVVALAQIGRRVRSTDGPRNSAVRAG